MENLKAFLYDEEKLPKEREILVSKRFLGEDNKPILWKIKALKEKEHQKIKEMQIEIYWGKMCAECVVFPNLKEEALLKSYGCENEDTLLKEMLTMGEYMILLQAVQQQNQFEKRKEAFKKEIKKP